jgi:glyoxylase-like protein
MPSFSNRSTTNPKKMIDQPRAACVTWVTADSSTVAGQAQWSIGRGRGVRVDRAVADGRARRQIGHAELEIDVDATVARAVEAGATATRVVEDRFHGDRVGQIEDPFGHVWSVQTHIEDVSPEEMQRRGEAAASSEAQRVISVCG